MRKLSFTIAFVAMSLVSTGTFAQNKTTKPAQADHQSKTEVKLTELPEAIITLVTSNFTEHTTAQAFKVFRNNKEVYLVFYTKENEKQEVLFDLNGSIIEQNKVEL